MAKRLSTAEIRRILEGLQQRGKLNPHDVIAEAQDPGHPLHGQFEWADSIAAAKYRLLQAEALIRRVRVKITYETARLRIPVYVKSENESPGYASMSHAKFEREDAEATLQRELARLKGLIERSRGIAAALDRKFPVLGLLEFFETELEIMARRPRPSAGRGSQPGVGAGAIPMPPPV